MQLVNQIFYAMKKYNEKKIIGLLLSALPIYSFFSWIYIFSQHPKSDQLFKVSEFNKIFFGISVNLTMLSIINILCSFVAIYCLINFKDIKNITIKSINAIVILLLTLIMIYNVWGLL